LTTPSPSPTSTTRPARFQSRPGINPAPPPSTSSPCPVPVRRPCQPSPAGSRPAQGPVPPGPGAPPACTKVPLPSFWRTPAHRPSPLRGSMDLWVSFWTDTQKSMITNPPDRFRGRPRPTNLSPPIPGSPHSPRPPKPASRPRKGPVGGWNGGLGCRAKNRVAGALDRGQPGLPAEAIRLPIFPGRYRATPPTLHQQHPGEVDHTPAISIHGCGGRAAWGPRTSVPGPGRTPASGENVGGLRDPGVLTTTYRRGPRVQLGPGPAATFSASVSAAP